MIVPLLLINCASFDVSAAQLFLKICIERCTPAPWDPFKQCQFGLSIKTRYISGVVFNKISISEIIQELPYFVKAKTTIDFANHTQNLNNYIALWKASIVDNSQTTELVFPVYLLLFWIGEEGEEERKLCCSKEKLGNKSELVGWYSWMVYCKTVYHDNYVRMDY